jgi:hypothetical protein
MWQHLLSMEKFSGKKSAKRRNKPCTAFLLQVHLRNLKDKLILSHLSVGYILFYLNINGKKLEKTYDTDRNIRE